MSYHLRWKLLLFIVLMATGPATDFARADEVSAQQERVRAPLRKAYIEAKQAERTASEKQQAALDHMKALLAAGNADVAILQKQGKELSNRLVEKRQQLKRAERALDIALGSHGRNPADLAVVSAQASRDAVSAEVSALEQELASNQKAEQARIQLPAGDQVYTELLNANLDLDSKKQQLVEAFVKYLAVLRPPDPPPYLQSVTVFAGSHRMYDAEWRVDDRAADLASREIKERLERAARDFDRVIREMQEERGSLAKRRAAQLESLIKYSYEINLAALDVDYNGQAAVIAPAVIEATGVVLEAFLTGGASTAERYATEQAVESAGKVLTAKEAVKRITGKAFSAARAAGAAGIEGGDSVLAAALSKTSADKFNYHKANSLIDHLNLGPGTSEATKIFVGDMAEQVIQRSTKPAIEVLGYKTATALGASAAGGLTKWQAVRTGAATFFKAKTPLPRIKDAFTASRSANLLGLVITAAKTAAAYHFGRQLGEAEERMIKNGTSFSYAYHLYYVALEADRTLAEEQRKLQPLYLQALSYRLLSAGPRVLKVTLDEGNDDATQDLTFRLHFVPAIDKPPLVQFAGQSIEMKPQGAGANGSSYWEGQLSMDRLPEKINRAVLQVSLAPGSKPYHDLDSNPATTAKFAIPDDLTKSIPNREEWTDFERGPDRHHTITLRNSIDPCLVGRWAAIDMPQFAGFEVEFRKDGTEIVDYAKARPQTFGNGDSIAWAGVGANVISTHDHVAKVKESRRGSVTMTLKTKPMPVVWNLGPLMGLAGLGGTIGDNKYTCTQDTLTYQGSTRRDRHPNFSVKLTRVR